MDNDRASYILQIQDDKTQEDSEENRLIKAALRHAIKNLSFTSKYLRRKLAELKELTGEDSPSSDFIKLTGMGNPISGTQQCHMIYNQMKQENFTEKPKSLSDNECYWAIPLVLIPFVLIGLIMLQK